MQQRLIENLAFSLAVSAEFGHAEDLGDHLQQFLENMRDLEGDGDPTPPAGSGGAKA
jgi:hypothetical protein